MDATLEKKKIRLGTNLACLESLAPPPCNQPGRRGAEALSKATEKCTARMLELNAEPQDPACILERKMQVSRFVITGSYLFLGGLAYGIGAVQGHILKVLCAIGLMPVSSVFSLWLMHRAPGVQSAITAVNLVLDTILTSWVIYWTGGTLSPCLPFYLTTVMAASFRFGPRGSLLGSLLAVACYCAVGALDPALPRTLHGIAGMALRISILFAAAGFGIRALHQKLERYRRERSLNRELERSNRDLAAAYQDLQATQDQLLHAEKLASIGRLVAGVAHEINNPISFIYGNLIHLETYLERLKSLLAFDDTLPLSATCREERERLKRSIDHDYLLEDLDRALRSSRTGAERIRKIVEALLNFSRARKAVLQEVDLREPLENALCILRSRINGNIEVRCEYGETPAIQGDPNELSQLFLNLLTNALDAVEGGGTIQVRTCCRTESDEQSRVLVEIQDDGPGIPAEDRDRIFEPFFTTKDVGKGTGLGLSIAYSIAKRHKGELSALCGSPRGTLFRVSLPIA
jgi:two-component system, NtrC family, sensor kinase